MPFQDDMHAQRKQARGHGGSHVRAVGKHLDAQPATANPLAQLQRESIDHGLAAQQNDLPRAQRLGLGDDVADFVRRQFLRFSGFRRNHVADIAIFAPEIAGGADFDFHGQEPMGGLGLGDLLRREFLAKQ